MIRDAVTFEVFRNAVTGIADEMAITILRTAHSQLVASSMDFSAALCDARGRVIAQANTLPVHLGSIPAAMEAIFAEFGDSVRPGDLYLLNDPSLGGMHLPDIFAVSPVFADETLLGFAVTVVNHTDVGGWAAGSMAVQSTNIFAEGIQIPPARLIDADTTNETFLRVLLRNVREPELLRGDLESQLAACHTGAEGLRALAARHGAERLADLIDELLDYSETLLRAALAEAVPGTYEFTDHIDDDGLGSGPIPIRVKATLSDAGIELDFTGSSPQVGSALNATESFTRSAAYAALQGVLASDIPANSGFYRPFSFVIPEASILNGQRPAARSARGLVGFRIIDAVLGALAPVFPDRVPAAGEGGPDGIAIGLVGPDGESMVLWDPLMRRVGRPARPRRRRRDQLAGREPDQHPGRRTRTLRPPAHRRLRLPARQRRCGTLARRARDVPRHDAAGLRGQRADPVRPAEVPAVRAGRSGAPGTPSLNVLDQGGPGERVLASKPHFAMTAGTRHRHVTAGGGGHGHPFGREPERVLEDVLDGKVTREGAARDYGVVIDDGGIDQVATAAIRGGAR